jgi:hypothetical protein
VLNDEVFIELLQDALEEIESSWYIGSVSDEWHSIVQNEQKQNLFSLQYSTEDRTFYGDVLNLRASTMNVSIVIQTVIISCSDWKAQH